MVLNKINLLDPVGPLSSKTLPSAIAAANIEAGVSQLAMCVMNDSSKLQSADKMSLQLIAIMYSRIKVKAVAKRYYQK